MKNLSRSLGRAVIAIGVAIGAAAIPLVTVAGSEQVAKPAIVLVHGAFAESASWNAVIAKLQAKHYQVIAAANPLRGVKSDAAAVAAILDRLTGPVVLVGHSYGGSVISSAAVGNAKVKALVFVAAFAPAAGETAAGLSNKLPGSTLGPALGAPVALADGGSDLYIQFERFRDQFAADVSAPAAALMAATQRPIAEAALSEASGAPAWISVPSWFIYGDADKNIPPAVFAFMAERAHAINTVVIKGASHVVMTSHPDAVVKLILEAAEH